MRNILFLMLFIGFSDGWAQSARESSQHIYEDSPWELQPNVDLLSGIFTRSRTESAYNPGNTTFEVDKGGNRVDLNLDFRMMYESGHKFVFRPRAYSQYQEIEFTQDSDSHSIQRNRGKLDLTEFFGEAWLSDTLSLTVGLQNYQWGPAETIGPSNPIFHFNREQRSLLWKEKGRNLVRINYTPSAAWSFILLSEPINNGERTFTADREFKPKNLLKAELRSEDESQNYVGLTGGTEEEGKTFAGAYFNWMPFEGFSIYTDFRMSQNGFGYRPQVNGFFMDMLEDDRFPENTWHHLGVAGLRYEHESFDARIEVISNSRGYTQEDFNNTFLTLYPLNPRVLINAERVQRPGMELTGKNYGYFSIRFPNVGEEEAWQLALRYLHSGMDGSGVLTGSAERSLDDHIILISEARQSMGAVDKEFTLQERTFAFLGLRILW